VSESVTNSEGERTMDTGVVASGEVVGGVFLAGYELLRVEKLAVCTASDFVDDSGFKIDKDGARYMLARSGFAEESVEGVVRDSEGGVTAMERREKLLECVKWRDEERKRDKEREEKPWHHAVGLNAMFETVEFPAGVSDLDPGLTDVNADDFSHVWDGNGRGGFGLQRRRRGKGRKRRKRVRDLRRL